MKGYQEMMLKRKGEKGKDKRGRIMVWKNEDEYLVWAILKY